MLETQYTYRFANSRSALAIVVKVIQKDQVVVTTLIRHAWKREETKETNPAGNQDVLIDTGRSAQGALEGYSLNLPKLHFTHWLPSPDRGSTENANSNQFQATEADKQRGTYNGVGQRGSEAVFG